MYHTYLSSIRAHVNEFSYLIFITHQTLYTWKETSSAASWQDNLERPSSRLFLSTSSADSGGRSLNLQSLEETAVVKDTVDGRSLNGARAGALASNVAAADGGGGRGDARSLKNIVST